MGGRRLDDDTVERILLGMVDPVDAPPGYEAAVTLLAAARGVPVPARPRVARPVRAAGLRPRVPVLAAVLVLGGASGAAYAAGLPAAASSTAHAVLRSLDGSAGPRTHAASGPSKAAGVTTAAHPPATDTDTDTDTAAAAERGHAGTRRHDPAGSGRHGHRGHHGHGAMISALAHSTSGTAGAKGAKISAAASGGKSHAGEHGHNGTNGSSHGQSHGHGGGRGHGHGHS